jgi:3-hydroxyacyl-[acyl-carrier-protein] dehydratase
MSVIDINEILRILPHRYPFLLVDRIVELDLEALRIVGLKNVTINEPFFPGHFPGQPVMPGVLQLEAMAQVAGILLNKRSMREGKIAYFVSIDGARFRRIVRPGDQLRLEITFVKARANFASVSGKITVDGQLATEAELMFSFEKD